MRKPDLGRPPLITQTFIAPEVELVDEGVDVPAMVNFRQLKAKYQLHVLRSSREDLRDVLPILAASDLQQGVLRDGLLLGVLLQQELQQHAGLPGQRIYARALSGRGCLGGTCTFLFWALGTFIRSCTGRPCIRRARGHGSLKLLVISSSRGARGRTLRDRRGGGGALLFGGYSSTELGLLGTMSVPLDLVAFHMGMVLVPVPLRHGDTGYGSQTHAAGWQARRAPRGRTSRCCEQLQ